MTSSKPISKILMAERQVLGSSVARVGQGLNACQGATSSRKSLKDGWSSLKSTKASRGKSKSPLHTKQGFRHPPSSSTPAARASGVTGRWTGLSLRLELTQLRKAVSAAIEAAHPGIKTDGSLHSLHQPARLAGWVHPETGKPSKLLNVDGTRYQPEELLKNCAAQVELPAVVQRPETEPGCIWREAEEDDLSDGQYPKPKELKVAVPLRIAISKKNAELIEKGQRPGEGTGLAVRAFSLSRALQAAKAQLQELGYKIDGTPEELFEEFCRNSDYLGKGDLESCFSGHYADSSDMGTGDLSKPALLKRITKWAGDNGHWRWKPKGFGNKSSSKSVRTAPPSNARSERDDVRRSKSVSHRLAVMRRYTFWITRKIRNALRRRVLLRDAVSKFGLGKQLKDGDIETLVMEAQDRGAGNVYKSLNHQERAAMTTPTVEWVIPELLPAKDAMTIVGSPMSAKQGSPWRLCAQSWTSGSASASSPARANRR